MPNKPRVIRRSRQIGWADDPDFYVAQYDTGDMISPVRCTHCRAIYDLGEVEITARYSDCSMWISPCCKRTVDDRGRGWKSNPDIEKLY